MPIDSRSKQQSVRVMATGVFDLLHPGHIYFLEKSRELGDELVVVVANDRVVSRTKAETILPAKTRAHLVGALRIVDSVVIPVETEEARYFQTVLDIAPDIITLGHDQSFSETKLQTELAAHGWQGKIVRIDRYPDEEISSSHLKKRIVGKLGQQ